MNWYKNAQHSNMQVVVNPTVDYGNPYGNNSVDVIHVPEDPYHKQKDEKREYRVKYEYFLSEKNRISKRTAVTAINRLARAVNNLVQSRRELLDTLESDEYKSLSRLIKSLVAEGDSEVEKKKALLKSLLEIESISMSLSDPLEKNLPSCYNNLSEYIDVWIRKKDNTKLKRKIFPDEYVGGGFEFDVK